ncbi:ARM repeat-containing protein [Auriculariales sp. MPI-PUGE-AT-0066]|nr:ARM repeat-containing protein [Auriculariales sp. MPI-PUGE-AT-0066]
MSATLTKSMSKKRPAPADSKASQQPPRKKQYLDSSLSRQNSASKKAGKPSAKSAPKHAAPPKDEQKKKRARPVTATHDESDDDDEKEDSWEDADEEDDDPMDEDGADGEPSGKASTKESRQQQKQIQAERRAAKPNSALMSEAKQIWRLAHQKNISKEERAAHITKLLDIVRGKVQEVVFKHDASRVIQTIVKFGGQKERDEIAAELKGKYRELSQNKYSKFLVSKLIRHSSAHRSAILSEFKGHVVRLLLHREASSVVADAYELYANAADRQMLAREFYGKEALLFGEIKPLLTLVSECNSDDEKKKRLLNGTKEQLELVFNNSEKGTAAHAIVHHALWEYLQATQQLSRQEDRDKFRGDMFEVCSELLAEFVHTKDGSRAVREFIAEGSAKDRKQIVKCIKPHLERIGADEEAQLVLFCALECIDDTKLTTKSLVQPLTTTPIVDKLATTAAGRRTLYAHLVPRSSKHFTVAIVRDLANTDSAKARTSKKDDAVRQDELRAAASPGLLDWATRTAGEAVKDTTLAPLLLEILLEADGDKEAAIAAVIAVEDLPTDPAARIFKTLLQGGHYSRTANAVEASSRWSPMTFARALNHERAGSLGLFVLAELCERVRLEGSDAERKELSSQLNAKEVARIVKSGEKGASVLEEKAKLLNSSL